MHEVSDKMIDTVYLHLEFQTKSGILSINLPFVCDQCGVCCKLEDFLTAGPVKVNPADNPQLTAKLKEIYEDTGRKWEADPEEYERCITTTPCPFVKDKKCTIYSYRPDGCRQFPNTPFGMLSQDCAALDRFKKQATAVCRGRKTKKAYHFTSEPIAPVKTSQKQYQNCITKLRKAGITEEEYALFESLNR
ncbi:YkgJ family cysteine cluster protein [Candidatus Bathyarchaeota archaeon]|nr:YkgJ family cysteine cluster protein [Candidatus Bathyarchaeota archaeon]